MPDSRPSTGFRLPGVNAQSQPHPSRPSTAMSLSVSNRLTETIRPESRPSTGQTAASSHSVPTLRRPRTATLSRQGAGERPATGRSARTGTSRPQTGTTSGGSEGTFVCAVLESRGVGREVGIAVMDMETGKCVLTQFADSQLYIKTIHHLRLHPPSTILVPLSAVSRRSLFQTAGGGGAVTTFPTSQEEATSDDKGSLLVQCLESELAIECKPLQRRHWSDSDGLDYLDRLVADDDSESANADATSDLLLEATSRTAILTAVSSKYYARCAACALFRHLEGVSNAVMLSRSLRISYAAPDGTVMIDTESAKNLELVENALSRNSKLSLFGVLNSCSTPMGTRLLRMSILQPLTNQTTIEHRLDAVEELIEGEERFYAVRESLKVLRQHNIDLDKLTYALMMPPKNASKRALGVDPQQTEANIARLLTLRTLLHSLPPIRRALSGASSQLLTSIGSLLESCKLESVMESIEDSINEDVATGKNKLASRNARAYAVKANRKPMLDVARTTFNESVEDILKLQEEYCDEYKLPFALKYNANSEYRLELKTADLEGQSLPSIFTNVVRSGKVVSMLTLDLKKRNAKHSNALNEVFLMSDEVINEVLQEVLDNIADLYKVSEALALLDMVTSFASVSISHLFVRPEFTGILAIKSGRHPVLDQTLKNGLVPNDVYAPDGATFFLILGPNMSGKSTFLRQVALLSIMAMIGCYVPAEYASIRLHDAILTRLANNDSIEQNLSTFASEMRATAFIISLVTDRSLVLVDELGRGTSPEEGFGIAHAVSEALIRSQAVTLFATHFSELNISLGHLPSVYTQHFSVSLKTVAGETGVGLAFHHRLAEGPSNVTHYGLRVAQLALLPEDLYNNAVHIAKELVSLAEVSKPASELDRVVRRRKLCLKTHAHLVQILNTSLLGEKELRALLARIREDIILKMSELFDSSTRDSESTGLRIAIGEEATVHEEDDGMVYGTGESDEMDVEQGYIDFLDA